MRCVLFVLMLQVALAVISPDPRTRLEDAANMACGLDDPVCMEREFEIRGHADQAVRTPDVARQACGTPTDQTFEDCARDLALEVDGPNIALARQVLDRGVWPAWAARSGSPLWLIVQHARTPDGRPDTALLERSLPLMRSAVAEGRLDPQDYARTADRIALNRGELQPYGTTRLCHDRAFDLRSTLPAGEVDENRRRIGFDILFSEALPLMNAFCLRDAGK